MRLAIKTCALAQEVRVNLRGRGMVYKLSGSFSGWADCNVGSGGESEIEIRASILFRRNESAGLLSVDTPAEDMIY